MSVRLVRLGLAVLWAPIAGSGFAGTIDPGLEQILASRSTSETISTLVYLNDAVDLDGLTATLDRERASLQRRHELVVRALQDEARSTQGPLLAHLDRLKAAGRISSFEPFWIANLVRVDAPPSVIEELAGHPSVGTIYPNHPVELIAPVAIEPAPTGGRGPEPGLVAIRAPEVWALGITGQGVLVAHIDTGVDGQHPALAGRWAGLADPRYAGHPEWAWHDAINSPPTTFPVDTYGHGTLTMGILCGGPPGDEVGVAPGAFWIADNCINQVVGEEFHADVIRAFQWMADPDGNPSTSWDVPAVCSNSWGVNQNVGGYPPCDPSFWSYIDACEAAGMVVLFSAGNEGPAPNTLRRPADRAADDYRNCAVGAVDANVPTWPIADLSSRGPSYCAPGGAAAAKPEIAAPGVNVCSAWPGGLYRYSTGTSMASPHVAGVVAMMRQACPDLPVEQIKQIIYDTARDLGPPGKDNSYGWGMIDAYAAVMAALDTCGPHPPLAAPGRVTTPLNTTVTVVLHAADDGLPDPPASLSYIIVSLPAHGRLTDPNAGPIYTVPHMLAGGHNQVVYRPRAYYSGPDDFAFKANDGGEPPEGGDSNIATIAVSAGNPELVYSFPLDTDPGWTTQADWAFGVPTGGGGEYGFPDPTSGHTGSNVYGYNLDGDYQNSMLEFHLTSTPIDCTRLTQISLRFWRWLGVEQPKYDHAYVRVSNDGVNFATVWGNLTEITDNAWVPQEIDIAIRADLQQSVYLRWTMGPTDAGWRYCGWNIDDIEIWAVAPSSILSGDLNCDSQVNSGDVNPFVQLLSKPAEWQATYPGCPMLNGDINADGVVDFGDINPFTLLLANP
jgi:subtilisin family serine protease